MSEEIDLLAAEMASDRIAHEGMRSYHEGSLWKTPCVLAFSRWGKVAAATTATHLIAKYKVSEILFTGVAGGASRQLHIGDVVVGTRLCQHDMDARPLFPQHEIPLLGITSFPTDPGKRKSLAQASARFIAGSFPQLIPEKLQQEFRIRAPQVIEGEIASGDKFFAKQSELSELKARLPQALCVEMEGAAVAQVCHEYGIPFSIIRTVSDSADEGAPVNFQKFIQSVASVYSHGIIKELLLCEASSRP